MDIDTNVLEELRRRSRRQGKSMGRVASEVLAVALTDPPTNSASFTWSSGRLGAPLVDLEDREALSRALESDG
jgi:hypothetical protein